MAHGTRPNRAIVARRFDRWVGVSYFLVAAPSLIFTRVDNGIALLWVATALLVSRLALVRPRRWPRLIVYCSIASMTATTLFGSGLAAAPLMATALIIEAMVGALLLRRFIPDGRFFDTIPRVGVFVGVIGIVMPAVSAFVGAAAANMALGIAYWDVWLDWVLAHGLGTLTAMPIITLAMHPDTRARLTEIRANWGPIDWALAGLAVAVNVAVFAHIQLPLLFLPMLPLVLLTVRHGRIGASGAIVLIAIIGGVFSSLSMGPVSLIGGSRHQEFLFLQFFLATCIVTALPMAAEMNRRRELTLRLQESEALFRLIADRSGDILIKLSPDGIIRYVSPSITKIGGFSPRQLRGTASIDLVVDEDRAVVTRAHLDAINHPNETFIYEYRARAVDGQVRWFETHSTATLDEDGRVTGVVNSVRDVSHRKALERRLQDEADTDSLTGLANRRVFDKLLTKAVSEISKGQWDGCLVIADIDRFKQVNDRYGHPVGDLVLREVAAILAASVRATDTVCRTGGEEFGFIVWGLPIDACQELCERIRERLENNPIMTPAGAIPVTISMGIVDIGKFATLKDAVTAADGALYQAKRAGRNRLSIAA
jgi:diguanylate cyclase (GGDEF)-like protein/PAS domain S-box-containing protein